MNANVVGLFIGIILALVTIYLILAGNKKSNASIEAKIPTAHETIPQQDPPAAPAVMATQVTDNLETIPHEEPLVAPVVMETRTPVDIATIPQEEPLVAPPVMEAQIPADLAAIPQQEPLVAPPVMEAQIPADLAAIPQEEPLAVSPLMDAQIPIKADDLTLVEGIGPKIASILQQHGIMTFAQLARAEMPALTKILYENGLQFAKPNSWPEQARLAAEGKMDELKALQDRLVAGR